MRLSEFRWRANVFNISHASTEKTVFCVNNSVGDHRPISDLFIDEILLSFFSLDFPLAANFPNFHSLARKINFQFILRLSECNIVDQNGFDFFRKHGEIRLRKVWKGSEVNLHQL